MVKDVCIGGCVKLMSVMAKKKKTGGKSSTATGIHYTYPVNYVYCSRGVLLQIWRRFGEHIKCLTGVINDDAICKIRLINAVV